MAALSVALGHCFVQVTGLALWGTSLRDFPSMTAADIGMRVTSALFPSDAAVMVFFVLSGHVLWGSFQRKQPRFLTGLPAYAAARFYRLYPLAIVSAIPIGLLSAAPAWQLAMNMLLLSDSLNGVLWSLQVEVVASFALFAVWGLTRGAAWKLAVALIVAFGATPFFRGFGPVVFFPAFILGAGISLIPPRLWRHGALVVVGLLLLVLTNVVLGHGGVTRCFEMAGATLVVGSVASGQLPFLRWRLPLFLGAISYPFYLTHEFGLAVSGPWLAAWAHLPAAGMILALAASSIALTIPLAWALHVCVENPTLRARPRLRP